VIKKEVRNFLVFVVVVVVVVVPTIYMRTVMRRLCTRL
jgi:hypothetical protein